MTARLSRFGIADPSFPIQRIKGYNVVLPSYLVWLNTHNTCRNLSASHFSDSAVALKHRS